MLLVYFCIGLYIICWCYWFIFCVDLYIICWCYLFVFCVSLYIICCTGLFFVSACTLSVDVTVCFLCRPVHYLWCYWFVFCVSLYIICWCSYWFVFCVGLYLLGGNLPALVLVQDVDIATSRQAHSGCVGTRYVYDADIWVVQIWHLSQLTLFFRSSRVT